MFGDRAQLIHNLMEKQRRIDALEEINQYLRDAVINMKMHATRPNISVIGIRGDTNFQYAMEVIDIKTSMHALIIRVKL